MNYRPLFAVLLAAATFAACKNDEKTAQSVADVTDPALAALNAQIAEDPDNDSLLFRRAEVFYDLEGYDEALVDLENAMKLDSMVPAYYHLMADVYLDYARPNDSRRAIEVLKSAERKFPGFVPTLLKLSEFQLIVRQHGDALASLDRILKNDPQNAEAFYMSGRVALDMGDTTRAIRALEKSVQLDAENADAWLFLGRIFSNNNNPRALQFFDNALRVDSTSLEAREFKGAYYKRRGEFDNAFAVYKDIIARNPDYSNAYFDMGTIYLDLDSLGKAYDNFNIAIQTDPLFVKAYYFRGITSEKQGRKEAALADYTQAAKMSPNYTEAVEAKERLELKK
jgi:tetratricopeptide (TPR) repeat protein